jgi:hypothetical protein
MACPERMVRMTKLSFLRLFSSIWTGKRENSRKIQIECPLRWERMIELYNLGLPCVKLELKK